MVVNPKGGSNHVMAVTTRSGRGGDVNASKQKQILDDDVELQEDEVPLVVEDVVDENRNKEVKIDIQDVEVETQNDVNLSREHSLSINVPLVEALEQMLGYTKFIKDLVTKKRSMDCETIKITHQVTVIVHSIALKAEKAIGWTLADIGGIIPAFCMHKIILEDDEKPSLVHQRMLNKAMQEVVKKEVIKWLDVGVLYPIFDSSWTLPRCMMAIFTDMVEDILKVFMDAFSIVGDSFDECLKNLDRVLALCEETNLVLNWEKCHFMVEEGIVLGQKISKHGI
ncbi:uncharacterized protein [Nicotiana sylvestris]|uniref:uncharacterized protein n=1 Tax=Nicotiana sylvestris TaxID=4096 RepID=UPI00388CC108